MFDCVPRGWSSSDGTFVIASKVLNNSFSFISENYTSTAHG